MTVLKYSFTIMDCNTASNSGDNNNNINCHLHRAAAGSSVHGKQENGSYCHSISPQDDYREFIVQSRLCELNRYKYYQAPPHQPHHLIYGYSGGTHLAFGRQLEASNHAAGNGRLDVMDSTAAAAAAAQSLITVDDNRRNVADEQSIDGGSVLVIDCHNNNNNQLAKYHDCIHPQAEATDLAKYETEANFYVTDSTDDGVSLTGLSTGDCARVEGYGKQFN